MNKSTNAFFVACGCLVWLQSGAGARPANEITIPNDPKYKLGPGVRYMKTDAYKNEVAKVVDEAKAHCQKFVGDPNCAIVLDLDETLFDSSDEYMSSSYDPKTDNWKEGPEANNGEQNWARYVAQAKAPPIPAVLEFAKWCNEKGFPIFFITGRNACLRTGTELNIQRLGVKYVALFMETSQPKPSFPEDFKTEYRRQIERQGYRIICNMGDQESDLYGLHADQCFKLPNQAYFTP